MPCRLGVSRRGPGGPCGWPVRWKATTGSSSTTPCPSITSPYGPNPLSAVTASVYRDLPGVHIHYATAYDERCNLDDGGWATVINSIRAQVENSQRNPDECEYCGERLDGEVCSNMACSINLEAA